MNNKPALAILLEFGFHEIKKYIHSGFARKLAEKFDIIWLAVNKNSKEFDEYFRNTGFPLIYIDSKKFAEGTKLEDYNQSVRRSYFVNHHKGLFHNYSTIRKKSFKTIIVGNTLFRYLFEKSSLSIIKRQYFSAYLDEIYKSNKVNMVLTTSYASSFSKAAMVTAHASNLKTWHLVNSWKDLFINNFLPFDFLDGIFVWSERMKLDYLKDMKYLNPAIIHVTGNPTFDALIDSTPARDRAYYSEKYRLNPQATWILYTMMPPGIVNDEIESIILVAHELEKHYTANEMMILVRRNPNHGKSDFLDTDLPENLRIADHYCTYDKNNDMIVQSSEGEQEWIDLLHHCSLNLSVPSTVSLEFLTLGKPVLNIGFGPDGKEDERVFQHFKAGFYRPLFEDNIVKKVMDISELSNILASLSARMTNLPSNNSGGAADKITQIISQS